MHQKFLLLVLVVIPTSLLLAGCAPADKIQESAATLKADVTEKVDAVVEEAKAAKDKVIEKKNQIEDAANKVEQAVDSVNEASSAVKTVIGN